MYFDIGDAMQAEIRQALKVVHSNYSYNSVDDDSERFKKMFPDSAIAQQYCMKSDKLAYIVNFGLSPYFKDILLSKTKQSLFLAVSFDESYCKAIHKKQMDVIIKYYDSKNVHTQYLTSQFLCHSRATDLKYHIEEALKDLTNEKIIQISMDGPKVNWCFFQKMVQQRNADGLPGLISLGSCSLHVLHGAFRHGVEETEWGVMSILRNLDLLLTSFNPGQKTLQRKRDVKSSHSLSVRLDGLSPDLLRFVPLKCGRALSKWLKFGKRYQKVKGPKESHTT